MTAEQEKLLISRILHGDKSAFTAIVDEHESRIYALALRTLGNPDDACDITQEVFLKAYTELSRFRGESRLSVWLYRMTYNLCIDLLRKQKRHPTTPILLDSDEEETEMEFPDLRYMPETLLEQKELQNAVHSALSQISPDHRDVLLMREYCGKSYSQIAEILGISEGTVKSRIARARMQLAKILIRSGTFSAFDRHNYGKEDR